MPKHAPLPRSMRLRRDRWIIAGLLVVTATGCADIPILYGRAQQYDSGNARARAGLASVEAEIRHRALIAAAEKLVNQDTYGEAEDVLRPVLAENLVVKSFYLAHADVKQIADMVRTLVETRDIFIDEKLNLLIITDTANAVQRAERLIAAQDLAGAEVILHVEVLEVAVNKLLEIGIRSPTSLTVTDPLFESKLLRSDGSTSVLANSRVRVKNKGKARIHIGDRVPVIATSAAAAGGFVLRSVTYRDVGLTIDVEPLIHAENQVAITVGLQVSNIAREVRSAASGTLTYQIGRRKTVTKLRLRDGETQVLAGLINDEDRRTANRFPGIGEFPVVGRLFSPTRDPTARTEIVLLITPRLLRTVTGPDTHSLEFAAGTEAASGAGGGGAVPGLVPAPPFMPEAPSAVTPAPSAAPPVIEPGSPPELFAPPLPRGVRVPLEDVQP